VDFRHNDQFIRLKGGAYSGSFRGSSKSIATTKHAYWWLIYDPFLLMGYSTSILYHCYLDTLIQHWVMSLLLYLIYITIVQIHCFRRPFKYVSHIWKMISTVAITQHLHLVQMYAVKLTWSLDRANARGSMQAEQEELPGAEHIQSRWDYWKRVSVCYCGSHRFSIPL
jgi:hypothetical protein